MKIRKSGRLARCIIFITTITTLVTCCAIGVFAKYKSELSGRGKIGVAKWEVKLLNVENPTMGFNSLGESVTTETVGYVFSIESKSEVTVECSVELTFNSAPPANVRLWIDDNAPISCNGVDTVYTLTGFDYAIEDSAQTHTLCVAVDYVKDDKLIDFNAFSDRVSVNIIAEQKAPTK